MATSKLDIIIQAENKARKELADLNKQLKNLKKEQDSLSSSTDNAGSSFKRWTTRIGAGVLAANLAERAIVSIGRSFGSFIKGSVDTALSVERINATLPILARNTGKTEEEIRRITLAIREENKSLKEAAEVTRGIVLAGLDEAKALQLITVARDVGATVGRTSADVNRLILESFQTLTPGTLKQVGINISLRETYKKLADQLGKNVTELTTIERQQGLLNAIFVEGDKFAGAYDAAMTTVQKVTNSVKDASEDLKFVLGALITQGFFPIVKEALNAIRGFRAWALTSENELNPALKNLSENIGTVVVGVFNALRDTINFLIETYKQFKTFLEDIGFIDALRNAFMALSNFIRNDLAPVIQFFKDNSDLLKGTLIFLFGAIAVFTVGVAVSFLAVLAAVGLAIVAVVATVDLIRDAFVALILKIIEIKNVFFTTWTAIENFFTQTWENLKNTAFSALDAIGERIRNILESIKNIPSSIGGKITSFAGTVKSKVGLAEGGIVTRPTLANIGESGPEAVIPLTRLGNVGGNNIVVNINGTVFGADTDRIGREVGDAIINRLGLNIKIG